MFISGSLTANHSIIDLQWSRHLLQLPSVFASCQQPQLSSVKALFLSAVKSSAAVVFVKALFLPVVKRPCHPTKPIVTFSCHLATAVTSQGQLLSSSCQKATAVIRRGKLFSFSFKRPQMSSVKANCLFQLPIGYNCHDQLFAFSCHSGRQSMPAAYFQLSVKIIFFLLSCILYCNFKFIKL